MTLESALQKLTPKQRQAVPFLAIGKTGKEVAITLNVNPATVSQWVNHNQHFNDALRAFADDAVRLAQIQLQALTLSAMEELRYLMKNAKSEQVRLKAVELVLNAVGGNSGSLRGQANTCKMIPTDAEHYDFYNLVETVSGGYYGIEDKNKK